MVVVEGEISYENFNASAAKVEIHGVSVHPGSAKNTMINALNVGIEFNGMLPQVKNQNILKDMKDSII